MGPTSVWHDMLKDLQGWVEEHEEQGMEIYKSDLYNEFLRQLKSKVAVYEDEKEEGTFRPDKEAKYLEMVDKLRKLSEKPWLQRWQADWLAGKCKLLSRTKQRVTSLSAEQEAELVKTGWACFDALLWKAAHGAQGDLVDWVANPARFISKRKYTVISMSDQIPCWIKGDGGKRLVKASVRTEARLRKRQRTSREAVSKGEKQKEEANEQPMTTVRTAGNPANSRYRVTLVARQLIHGYFDTGEPQGLRKPSFLPLITQFDRSFRCF